MVIETAGEITSKYIIDGRNVKRVRLNGGIWVVRTAFTMRGMGVGSSRYKSVRMFWNCDWRSWPSRTVNDTREQRNEGNQASKWTCCGQFVGYFPSHSHESPTLSMYERIIASPTTARIDLVAFTSYKPVSGQYRAKSNAPALPAST